MRRTFLLIITILALGLAGCLPKSQTTPTSTATTIAQLTPTNVVTLPEQSSILLNSGCTVVTQKPTPGATAESAFPPITDSDWVKGPADAKVTIIEYSDFQ